MFRLALTLFLVQGGFHSFTASLPIALASAGVSDPEIGLIVGSSALVQIPAALVAGVLIDRFGGLRMLYAGAAAYLLGALVLLAPPVEPGAAALPFVVARGLQGVGIATALPSALWLVPGLVTEARRAVGLAFTNSAHNLTVVVLPPISLAVLDRFGLDGVAAGSIVLVLLGSLVGLTMASAAVPPTLRTAASGREPSVRRFGFAVRRQWLGPVVIVFLTLVHWGVLSTYLPARAERAGADIGLFFAADGIAIVLSRVPTGWVADRVSWRLVVGCGLALLLASLGLAALPPTTPLLALSGALNGAGAAIALTPNLVELTRRSDDEDRGSALALYGATLAGGLSVGSVAAAPIVAMAGFEGAVGLGLLGLVAAGTVLLLAERDRPMASVEVAPIGPP